ncbi:hypothetical protein E8E12_003862 [Didymella heteroderae]|uniref:Uncharacterized protein n=1 Tax=Didymella heteroderae TaxID=1769908 RepID=A0A9P4WWQ5_9PLEO|nr:hypothetical protein E8E12_003862 [Didymella heteroderae]
MDASTRLYARLGEIPEDPDNSESLDDLIVCAFGAFERYYLCWKTKGGEFRQDGYDLPPALNDWLNPTDGSTRDWASLQVVFGRGEEYFASDKNGKLEFKEPEVKKSTEGEEKEKVDRQALRRSRTVSFLRPLSQTSNRSEVTLPDAPVMTRRTSSISSQRASRPPSLSYSTTGPEASIAPFSTSQTLESAPGTSSLLFSSLTSVGKTSGSDPGSKAVQSITSETVAPDARADSTAFTQGPDSVRTGIPSIPEETVERFGTRTMATSETCRCGCHDPPLPQTKRPTYADASVQTDPMSSPPRTSLRVDTFSASAWSTHSYSAVSRDVRTPIFDNFGAAPFSMGRMTNYFSKPGYQLGDSLSSGYQYYEQPVYQYQDEFGDEALR